MHGTAFHHANLAVNALTDQMDTIHRDGECNGINWANAMMTREGKISRIVENKTQMTVRSTAKVRLDAGSIGLQLLLHIFETVKGW